MCKGRLLLAPPQKKKRLRTTGLVDFLRSTQSIWLRHIFPQCAASLPLKESRVGYSPLPNTAKKGDGGKVKEEDKEKGKRRRTTKKRRKKERRRKKRQRDKRETKRKRGKRRRKQKRRKRKRGEEEEEEEQEEKEPYEISN